VILSRLRQEVSPVALFLAMPRVMLVMRRKAQEAKDRVLLKRSGDSLASVCACNGAGEERVAPVHFFKRAPHRSLLLLTKWCVMDVLLLRVFSWAKTAQISRNNAKRDACKPTRTRTDSRLARTGLGG
jgi:hypothetical protein